MIFLEREILFVVIISILTTSVLFYQVRFKFRRKKKFKGWKKISQRPQNRAGINSKKPDWVKKEVLYLKMHLPDFGCRKIADVFNRRYYGNESVSKSYVADLLKREAYRLADMKKRFKNKTPHKVASNLIWGVDLTGKADINKTTNMILGIVDHGTRACLKLERLNSKSSFELILKLIEVIREFGLPKIIRTDIELRKHAARFGF